MSVRKCRPLQRVLFLNEFRRAHLDFWKNNHPAYPNFSLASLPPLVRRTYRVGQGFRKPQDLAHANCTPFWKGRTQKNGNRENYFFSDIYNTYESDTTKKWFFTQFAVFLKILFGKMKYYFD